MESRMTDTSVQSAGPRPKPSSTAAEKRKLRNRLSQQAFRARQHLEANELKQRLAQFEGSESERNLRLTKENQFLRKQLWQCEKKLRSLQAGLKTVVDSMIETRGHDYAEQQQQQQQQPNNSQTSSLHRVDEDSASSSSTLLFQFGSDTIQADNAPARILDVDSDVGYGQNPSLPTEDLSIPAVVGDSLSGLATFDQAFTFLSNTALEGGPAPVTDMRVGQRQPDLPDPAFSLDDAHVDDDVELVLRTALAPEEMPWILQNSLLSSAAFTFNSLPQVTLTPSIYCQHIDAYEMCVMRSRLLDGTRILVDLKSLTRAISAIVTSFVKIAWSGMESWMHYTNGSDTLAKMTAWRVAPGPETLAAIPPCLRPTALQAAVPHPSVIDWCVFPFLRDRLIQYHSGDPALDDICGDIGLAYVVQADLSELVASAQPLLVNLSVLDIVHGMIHSPELPGRGDPLDQNDPACHADASSPCFRPPRSAARLPAPNLRVLLHTKEYAWALYRHLGIAGGGDGYRIDTALFVKYPHLYEPDASIAQGVPLRSLDNKNMAWPAPRPLDSVAMETYRRCVAGGVRV